IDDLVFDFGELGARLLIELDGGIHDLPDVQLRDEAKGAHAAANNFTLLRLKNDDVWSRPDWAVDQVRAALARCIRPSPPNPPRSLRDRRIQKRRAGSGPEAARERGDEH